MKHGMVRELRIMVCDLEMDRLPLLAVEVLCRYLSVSDLTACSAVSRGWRAVFNQDTLWRPYCEPSLEEVLKTMGQDMTELTELEPLCQYRAAYIHQNCLIDNWKHVRFSSTEIKLDCKCDASSDHKAMFVTDDFIVVTCIKAAVITLWNMKSQPPLQCAGLRLFQTWSDLQNCVGQSRTQGYLICVKHCTDMQIQEWTYAIKSVQIIQFDLNSMSLQFSYIFTSKQFLSECEEVAEPTNIITYENLIHRCCIVEHFFLVAFAETPGAGKIHIWDLQSGEQIKKVPLLPNEYFQTFEVAGQDVLVVTFYYKKNHRNIYVIDRLNLGGYRYYIFNIKHFTFLPFSTERVLMIREGPHCDRFGVINNYVIIQSVLRDRKTCYTFQIFNYNTSKLLHESRVFCLDSDDGYLQTLSDGFIYCGYACKPFVLFDPQDETVLTLVDSNSNVDADLLDKIWNATETIKSMFVLKHVLFSNVSGETITGLADVGVRFSMNPSFCVGIEKNCRKKVLSIIKTPDYITTCKEYKYASYRCLCCIQ